MVRETPDSGSVILAPWQLTVAQVVNLGSGEFWRWGDVGGRDIGVVGRGVEVIGKLLEVVKAPRSKVPPVLVGLECPPEILKFNLKLSLSFKVN